MCLAMSYNILLTCRYTLRIDRGFICLLQIHLYKGIGYFVQMGISVIYLLLDYCGTLCWKEKIKLLCCVDAGKICPQQYHTCILSMYLWRLLNKLVIILKSFRSLPTKVERTILLHPVHVRQSDHLLCNALAYWFAI